MKSFKWSFAAALLVAGAACASSPSDSALPPSGARQGGDQGNLKLAITTAPVRAGEEVDFTFTNGEDGTVTTGELSCVNHYERDEGNGNWRRLKSFRMCIMLAMIHAPGEISTHRTHAPDGPGTYRLVVEAWGEKHGRQMTARSAPFEVLAAP